MKKKPELPIIRAPKGHHFFIYQEHDKNYIHVILLDKHNRKVGYVDLHVPYPYKQKKVATHSYLSHHLRGKKIGTKIYAKAIEWALKHGYKVKSSGSSSEDATRVWQGKGLRKLFDIKSRHTDYGLTWYANPKPNKGKGRGKSRERV